jgi:pimeloyl-ACP methyl ester carboxylesterase
MHLASTGGVDLVVHDLGGDGPPLLLCHATGFHGRVWVPLARVLTDRFHLWAVDFRGHGDSSAPADGDFSWSGFADDVLTTVDALGLERPLALGHSKGGAALLLAEQARPGTMGALYVFEPIVFPPGEAPEDARRPGASLADGAERRRQTFASTDDAFENFASKPPLDALAPAALRAYVEHGLAPTLDGEVRLKCRPADEAQVYRMGGRHGAWDALGDISCPVTVAAGGTSPVITPAVAKRIAERIPAGRVDVFDGLGHFGPLEDPPGVAEAVAATFAEHLRSPA